MTNAERIARIRQACEADTVSLEDAHGDRIWLLAQLDDATIRGDKLYQYGRSADAAYAELARILRETEEQAQAQVDAANEETGKNRSLLIAADDFAEHLADIRARAEMAEQYAHLLKNAEARGHLLTTLSDVHELLMTVDAANTTIARLQQADIAGIERDNADLTGQLITLRAERDAWRERATIAEKGGDQQRHQ